jgi:hypothetical protein
MTTSTGKTPARLYLAGLLSLTSLVFTGGCSSEITADDVRGDPTPELESMAFTSEERKSIHARTFNTQFRQIPDDIDEILLLDRPVRFSPRYPIP